MLQRSQGGQVSQARKLIHFTQQYNFPASSSSTLPQATIQAPAGFPSTQTQGPSQSPPYSLCSALLLTRAHRAVVHYIGKRVQFGTTLHTSKASDYPFSNCLHGYKFVQASVMDIGFSVQLCVEKADLTTSEEYRGKKRATSGSSLSETTMQLLHCAAVIQTRNHSWRGERRGKDRALGLKPERGKGGTSILHCNSVAHH